MACFVGSCIYFVAGVSGTSAPIKTYDYTENVDTLTKRLHKLTHDNKSLSFTPTDTTGTKEKGYNYYFTLHWISPEKDTIEYNLALSRTDYWFAKNKTIIELVEAINLTHFSGGYSEKANGMQPLINNFEINILPTLTHKR